MRQRGRADRRTLIRRATFDLHGLPPTPAEVEAFVNDSSPDAFARVIERLLASPRYGQRWGRHWLDIARYADSNGMDENMAMAHAWRYRDWVIAALQPRPAVRRVSHASNSLAICCRRPTNRHDQERLIATGFLVLGPKMLAEDDPVKMEMDIIDEQVDTVGRAFMGLTLGCARCHDHKFDPIPTADYYALAGIFKSTKTMENHRVVAMWSERLLGTKEELAALAAHEQRVRAKIEEQKARSSASTRALLDEARGKLADTCWPPRRRRQQATQSAILADLSAESCPTAESRSKPRTMPAGNVVRDADNYGARHRRHSQRRSLAQRSASTTLNCHPPAPISSRFAMPPLKRVRCDCRLTDTHAALGRLP